MRLFKHDPECYAQMDDADESECTCGAWDEEINSEIAELTNRLASYDRIWENMPEELSLKSLLREIKGTEAELDECRKTAKEDAEYTAKVLRLLLECKQLINTLTRNAEIVIGGGIDPTMYRVRPIVASYLDGLDERLSEIL